MNNNDIHELLRQPNTTDTIRELKSGRQDSQDAKLKKAIKALNPQKHDIHDPIIRPDKRIRVDLQQDETNKVIDMGEQAGGVRIERVARVALALQKLIVTRAVSFCFGNPVAYNATPEGERQELILRAFNRILHDNKTNALNRKVASDIFAFGECAELWYPQEQSGAHNAYGFTSKFKLRHAIFSPALGDALYPYYDEGGDLVAFSRGFEREDSQGKTTSYFETYTNSEHWLWRAEGNSYTLAEGFPKPIAIGKIPIVYGKQEHHESHDVDALIDRLEKLLSNFADTNDYHASPKIFVTGQINGWSKKGEAGAVIEGEEGATMSYVSWQNAPESVRLEIDTLLKMIYTITQTPDISFDSVKGLGAVSGVALKLLFMDAHLKVQDKRVILDEYLQRRTNIIKAYIGKLNTQLEQETEQLEIEPEITPYSLTNELDEINMWLAANGNKPLVSQKASVKGANLTQDPERDFEQIQEEANAEGTLSFAEATSEE